MLTPKRLQGVEKAEYFQSCSKGNVHADTHTQDVSRDVRDTRGKSRAAARGTPDDYAETYIAGGCGIDCRA